MAVSSLKRTKLSQERNRHEESLPQTTVAVVTAEHVRSLVSLYDDSADKDSLIAALRLYDREQTARRIEYLYSVADEDPTEDRYQ